VNRRERVLLTSLAEGVLPDPPENREFLEFDPAFQDLVAARFDRGVDAGERGDIEQLRVTKQASRDCAKRFADAAAARVGTATIGDGQARRRREGTATIGDGQARRRRDRRPRAGAR
jgi:hypothetical protein